MTSVAGVFFAFYYNNLFPEQVFHISRSIELILAPIIGGIGTLFGPILGAFLLTGLSEAHARCLLRARLDVPGAKQVFYGVCLLVVVMRCRTASGRGSPAARPHARAADERVTALLEVEGRQQALRGLLAVDDASASTSPQGDDLRGDRPERRRQDHAVQHDRRRVRARRRARSLRRRAHRRPQRRRRSAAAASAAPSRWCGRSRR